MQKWYVFVGKRLIDEVYYQDDCDADYVRIGLIVRDGYPSCITVKRCESVLRGKS